MTDTYSVLTVDDRRTILEAHTRQFEGELFGHAMTARRAEARLEELGEGDPDRPTILEAIDRAHRDCATLRSALEVNRVALEELAE